MFDNIFFFTDPIIKMNECSLFDFIFQVEIFCDAMEEKGELLAGIQRSLSEDTYKEMWMLRYQQHLGNLSFLELLDKYEEILGITK